jgi:hypothetical protein
MIISKSRVPDQLIIKMAAVSSTMENLKNIKSIYQSMEKEKVIIYQEIMKYMDENDINFDDELCDYFKGIGVDL